MTIIFEDIEDIAKHGYSLDTEARILELLEIYRVGHELQELKIELSAVRMMLADLTNVMGRTTDEDRV